MQKTVNNKTITIKVNNGINYKPYASFLELFYFIANKQHFCKKNNFCQDIALKWSTIYLEAGSFLHFTRNVEDKLSTLVCQKRMKQLITNTVGERATESVDKIEADDTL